MLPIPEPKLPPSTELDVRHAKASPKFQIKVSVGAPNVFIVLIDDMGFGKSNSYDDRIHTPTLVHLAKGGRYNKFHTTSLCSPTRMALLTERNHHVNNVGAIMELATCFPVNMGIRHQHRHLVD